MGVREGVAAAAIVADRMRRALKSFWLSNHSIAIRQDERAVPETHAIESAHAGPIIPATIRVSSGCPQELEERQRGPVAGNPKIGVERCGSSLRPRTPALDCAQYTYRSAVRWPRG